ncbi:flavin reductase [Streptomyces sp. WAC05374]|uniref:flavin reductase family protein n=1 Tax=Streptomyces sp. WAC05374 TaxID=2487420 RepID=UPI000F85DBDA|nr:flavin reductase family protein [Streptomyces sp. WAC05374]RST14340.1 flavin reductase [Streptomyces sp. WAC05374]TDF41112.1 flavin reductase [Streptomyces sp. WAC05374]TDF49729.1 flavin reductase [Streptomyces sp. WAC05374]TDF51382.1 flavin reductase [Streptomyces sp. WAC05374]
MTSHQPAPVAEVGTGRFRQAMGRFLTGVAVVTSSGPQGPHGTTISSLASVSLDPPMLLVCLSRHSYGAEVIRSSGTFTVNVLGRDQSELAGWFATPGRPRGAAGFAGVAHRTGSTGAPVLDGAVSHLDCRVAQRVVAGDHTIFIGEVAEVGLAASADPLAYHQGQFLHLP